MTTAWDRFALKGEVGQPGAAGSAGVSGTFARDNPGGRLTLVSGNPIPTSDTTGGSATTIYYTPYQSNVIALYDGANWAPTTFSEVSSSLSGLTTSQPYDVFGYLASNVFTLEVLAWTNGTGRATGLSQINGVLCKNDGVFTHRYLGTIQLQATSQGEDSAARRYVFNQYNRVLRRLRAVETATDWNYTTHTWRQANTNSANQVSVLCGCRSAVAIAELEVHLMLTATSWNNANAATGASRESGIGVDSTSAPHADCVYTSTTHGGGNQFPAVTVALLDHMPSIGKHDFTWLERAVATNTTKWFGAGTVGGVNGLSGHVLI